MLVILLLIPAAFSIIIYDNENPEVISPPNTNEDEEDSNNVVCPDNTVTFSAKEALKPQNNPKIRGTRGYIGTSYPVGDWFIDGDAVVWNETIILNGNLTVNETGNLTLINVTLELNCSFNGEYHIEVRGGGELYIYDYDWDRFTMDDCSNITAVNTSNKYLFWVQKDSYFKMRNSKLSWCGYEWGTNGDLSGMWINTNYAFIDGNVIENTYYGMIFFESYYSVIENNTISNNIENQVKYSGLNAHVAGVYLSSSYECRIINNYINNLTGRKWDGIGAAVYLSNSNNNTVQGNVIFNIEGGDGKPSSSGNGHAGGMGSGIYIYQSNYLTITNNKISNNTGGNGGRSIHDDGGQGGFGNGVYFFKSSNIIIVSNMISNNSGGDGGNGSPNGGRGGFGTGIYSHSSDNFIIQNNRIKNSIGGGRGYGYWHNGLGGHGFGLYIRSSDNGNVDNNIITASIGGFGTSGYGYGVGVFTSNGISLNINEIYDCEVGIRWQSSDGYGITNSTINRSSDYDIYLNKNSHLTAINTSFDKNMVGFENAISTLTVKWYFNVKVTIYDIPVNKAIIQVRENDNGTFNEMYTTNCNGFIKYIPLVEYIQSKLGKTYFTPHELEASIDSYGANASVWMDRSKTIIVHFGESSIPMFIINLNEGWNLISLPFIQFDTNLETVLKSIESKYDTVWCYNASNILDYWGVYNVSKPPHLNDLDLLNHKKGIWIHVNASGGTTFPVKGIKPTTQQTINLHPGWNLVGYPSIVNRPRDEALNNIQFGTDIDVIYYYNSTSNRWMTIGSNDIIRKGVGYWVFSKSKVTWIINNTPLPVYNLNKDLQYDTIQDAVNDADPFDTIEISPGIFKENVNINKSINIVGKAPKSVFIDGGGGTCINISGSYLHFNNLAFVNCSYGLNINNSSDIRFKNIFIDGISINGIYINCSTNIHFINIEIYNSSTGIFLNNSTEIKIINAIMKDNINGINLINHSDILIINSTIINQDIDSFILKNSTIILLNSTFNYNETQFLDANSEVIVQWYLHVKTIDQLGYSIKGTTVRVRDNNNGTFDENHTTDLNGLVRWIIVTQLILNSTINMSSTPHNISVYHPGFTFIEYYYEKMINKSTTIIFISVNTVMETPIHNLNKNRYYLTIKEAIDDSEPNDTIQLSSGTYFESIIIDKPLILEGEDASSTIIDGGVETCINVTFNDVIISNLNLLNSTYGIYCNNLSPIINGCIIENNTIGIIGLNSSYPVIINTTLQNNTLELFISESYFTSLNSHFNVSRVMFLDVLSNLTVQWYLNVRVQDSVANPLEGANVWIVDNENGSYDKNFTTGRDGNVWYIVLTERIQNLSGNISFNPYTINVSYYDDIYGNGWVYFPDNPRNITINGSVYEIRKEIFTNPDIIPEFSQILIPIIAITATFIVFRKRRTKPQTQ